MTLSPHELTGNNSLDRQLESVGYRASSTLAATPMPSGTSLLDPAITLRGTGVSDDRIRTADVEDERGSDRNGITVNVAIDKTPGTQR